jgi:hypothetical protein
VDGLRLARVQREHRAAGARSGRALIGNPASARRVTLRRLIS